MGVGIPLMGAYMQLLPHCLISFIAIVIIIWNLFLRSILRQLVFQSFVPPYDIIDSFFDCGHVGNLKRSSYWLSLYQMKCHSL